MKQSKKIIKNESEGKKFSKKIKKEKAEESSEAVKLIKIILIVVFIFFAMYGLTYLLKGKKTTTDSTFKFSNEILVGQMWNRTATNAIILLDYFTDSDVSTYQTDIQNFVKTNSEYGYYSVDLASVFNKNYIGDTSNINVKDSSFRVTGLTILVIKDGAVIESYEGKDSVAAYAAKLESEAQSATSTVTSTTSESTLLNTGSTN